MTTDFQANSDGELRVKDKQGVFQFVPTPDGFTPWVFRNAVAAYDTAYRAEGVQPTPQSCHDYYPQLSEETFGKLFQEENFWKALALRGWAKDESLGLDAEANALLISLNTPDGKSLTAKLQALGISYGQYRAISKNALFKKARLAMAQESVDAGRALEKLAESVEDGSMPAIQMTLAMTGTYDPASREALNVRAVVTALAEVIVEETADDPELRQRMLDRLRAKMAVTQAVVPQILEG